MADQEGWKKRLLIFGPGIELKWDIDEILKCDFSVSPPAFPPAHPLAGLYNDIPYQLAYDAYRASSFSPERRANDDIKSYANYLINTYSELSKGRTPEQQNQLDTWFRTFRKKYRDKYLAWENARSRTASAFVVGPANFPTRSNQKKLATVDRRYQELIDYENKALTRIKKDSEIYPENKVNQPIQSGASDALERLKQKLAVEERNHALMKEVNRIIRKNKDATYAELLPKLKAAGLSAEVAAKVLVPDYAGKIGFKGFELTNSNQRIKRLKERIVEEEKIQARRAAGAQKKSFDGGFVEEDTADNRLRIYFDDIPPADLRSRLKLTGWRWSRKNMAWQRQATDNAWRSAKDILGIAGLPGKWRPYVV